MKKVDLYISSSAPSVNSGAAWLKPIDGGYTLYVLDNGWKPLKLINDANTPEGNSSLKNIKTALIGSVQDESTANTINGAKAYAKNVKETITGKNSDVSSDLTLKGLKAYIDEKIAKLKR